MATNLTSRIPDIVHALPVRTEALALDVAQETASLASELAPVGATGDLSDSIEARPTDDGAAVYALWRWFFSEFGTVNQAAHPYMTPAFEAAYASLDSQARRRMAGL